MIVDKAVHIWCRFTVGTTGTAGNAIEFRDIPLGIQLVGAGLGQAARNLGSANVRADGTWYICGVVGYTSTSLRFLVNIAGYLGNNPSVAIQSGEQIGFTITYQMA